MLARGSPPRSKRQRSRLEGGGRLIATSATTTLLRRPCYEGIGWNITYPVTGGLYDESKFRFQVDFRSLAEKTTSPSAYQPRGHFIQQSLDVHHEHSLPLNYLALPSTGPCHLPRAKYGSSFPCDDFRDRIPSRHKSHTWCSGPMLERTDTQFWNHCPSRDDEALPPHAPPPTV
ncbi:hypothetical protein QR685DRAFT_571599 [Neurospora intermedia]|uniref:Uncharacterized protein n=1 Tax=Neurospora intermedia TaxID=5142 RepID=A0ABR3DCU2_NEUIN